MYLHVKHCQYSILSAVLYAVQDCCDFNYGNAQNFRGVTVFVG